MNTSNSVIDKESRRCRVFYIESLEVTVSNAQRALKAAQHDYLLFLGFTHEVAGKLFPGDIYYYQDTVFMDIDHALEYADEYI